jgi:hypothetical protein
MDMDIAWRIFLTLASGEIVAEGLPGFDVDAIRHPDRIRMMLVNSPDRCIVTRE